MLLECRQFEELHSEFDRWLVTVEEELASDPAQKLNTQRLNRQNKVNILLVLEKRAFGGQHFVKGVASLISFWQHLYCLVSKKLELYVTLFTFVNLSITQE